MTTTKSRATNNGQTAKAQEAEPNPLLTNQPPPQEKAEPDWKARAQQLDQEVRFWKMKYFEQMQHSQQVIAALARPQLEQDARAQQAQAAELMSKFAAMQGNQS